MYCEDATSQVLDCLNSHLKNFKFLKTSTKQYNYLVLRDTYIEISDQSLLPEYDPWGSIHHPILQYKATMVLLVDLENLEKKLFKL